MENGNPIRTLGDYSRPIHEGYQNTIELPDGNNVVPLRSDTIQFLQNGCSFHGLQSEDPNQHLKDFLKILDSLDLNEEMLNTNILMFQQYQGESLSEAWTRFKDLLQKVPHHAKPLRLDSDNFHLDRNDGNLVDKESKASKIVSDEEELSDYEINDDRCEIVKQEEWMEYEELLDLVDTHNEPVYESLIDKMQSCSSNSNFRIKKGDPSNLKIPCMTGRKFIANAYIDLDSPMNVMSLACYNAIRNQGYDFRGQNFVGIGRDMHVFVGIMSHIMDFTILKNVEATIDPSLSQVVFGRSFVKITKLILDREQGLITFTNGIKEVTFKTSYRDSKMDDLTSEGHDLLSSKVILSEDEYRRGCERASDLESGFYKDIDKLGPSYKNEIERIDLDESLKAGGSRTSNGGVT
ncbi:hypothetical protein Tco_0456704 [Tanacetum coccineum]